MIFGRQTGLLNRSFAPVLEEFADGEEEDAGSAACIHADIEIQGVLVGVDGA